MKTAMDKITIDNVTDFEFLPVEGTFEHKDCNRCQRGWLCAGFAEFIRQRKDSEFLFKALAENPMIPMTVQVPMYRTSSLLPEVDATDESMYMAPVVIIPHTAKGGGKIAFIELPVPSVAVVKQLTPAGGTATGYPQQINRAGETYLKLGAIVEGQGLADIKSRVSAWSEGQLLQAASSNTYITCKSPAGSRGGTGHKVLDKVVAGSPKEVSRLAFTVLHGSCPTCYMKTNFDFAPDIPRL